MVRTISIILTLIFSLSFSQAQVEAFAEIKLSRSEVYPEQPIKATITVSTATWFTAPLNFENLQVPNAFVIPFKRTLSTQIERNGKSYPSLQFYYLIYPYQSGEFEVPELIIQIETPEVGDYKGQSATVRTKAVAFSVKEPPTNFDATWFIANTLQLTDNWNADVTRVKVGDVLERQVTVNAQGTLPKFIPELELVSLHFASVYGKSPILTDKRNNQTANGERIEKAVYLFEKEGVYEIPEVRIDWWNPYQQKAYFKRIPSIKVEVLPNPDLGMIASIRDSLSISEGVQISETTGSKNSVLGIPLWQFLLLLGVIFILLVRLYRFTIRQFKDIKRRREAYLKSEEHYFQEVLHFKGKDSQEYRTVIYRWWDSFRIKYDLPPSLTASLQELKSQDLQLFWANVAKGESPPDREVVNPLWTQFRQATINDVTRASNHFSTLQGVSN